MTVDPRDIGRIALYPTVATQDGAQFVVDGIRHTVNTANNPNAVGHAYHSQHNIATGQHETHIVNPDGTVR